MYMLVIKLMAPPFLHSHSGRLQSGWLNLPTGSTYPVLPYHVYFVFITLLKDVSHYDVSVLFMSVMGSKKRLDTGVCGCHWVGGVSTIQFCLGFCFALQSLYGSRIASQISSHCVLLCVL